MNSAAKKPETKRPLYRVYTGDDIDKGVKDLARKLIMAVPKDDEKGQAKRYFWLARAAPPQQAFPWQGK